MNHRILISLVVIGAVAATAAGTTLSAFNDTEASDDNVFTAGELDLKVDYTEFYNGEQVDSQNLTDDPGTVFDLADVKPGDNGSASLSMHVYDNPAYVTLSIDDVEDLEAGCTEPEADAENGSCGTEGELFDNMEFTVWNDDGDGMMQQDENLIATGGEVGTGTGTDSGETEEVCRNVGGNVDMALTMDRSGSMFGEKLSGAKNGSNVLLDSLGQTDQSSLVAFSSSATLDQALTSNHTATKEAVDDLSAFGGTNIEEGVRTSSEELINGSSARENVSKVMVVLSDGQGSGNPVEAANESKDMGIRVITVAYGQFAANDTLRQMASSENDFYFSPSPETIESTFGNISQTICEPVNDTVGNQTDTVNGSTLQEGVLLDADPSTEEVEPFENSTTRYVGFGWELPFSTGNEAQADVLSFDIELSAEQARHNDDPGPGT